MGRKRVVVITVAVHPVDDTHRTGAVPIGWRWCVQFGDNYADATAWLNAGWCPTESDAAVEGEMVGVTAFKALKAAGVPAAYAGAVHLVTDPTI